MSSCVSFINAQMVNSLGIDKTELLLRDAIRACGRYRGNEMRREVESRGLPLDTQHLLKYWDYSGDLATVGSEYIQTPHYCSHNVLRCSYGDVWLSLCPQRLAVVMCEEIHVAVAKEFNPSIEVWYPSLLTRGESKCIFRFSMPIEAAEKAKQQAQQRSVAALESGHPLAGERQTLDAEPADIYRAVARFHVVFYHSIVNEMLRMLGVAQTEDILRQAMRKWGTWRGREMAEDHRRRGWLLDVQTFITYFDDPAAGDAWTAINVMLSPKEHTKDIPTSPYSYWFEKLGTGRFAAIMFENALPAQAEAYNPAIKLTITKLIERGDPLSSFSYKMV